MFFKVIDEKSVGGGGGVRLNPPPGKGRVKHIKYLSFHKKCDNMILEFTLSAISAKKYFEVTTVTFNIAFK